MLKFIKPSNSYWPVMWIIVWNSVIKVFINSCSARLLCLNCPEHELHFTSLLVLLVKMVSI